MTAPTPVPNPHVKDGISYGHLFASYTEGTADTSLDLDPYPDERFLTGTVLLRPRFSGQQATAVLRVPGTPRSRGLVITEQEYKVVQSRLVDRQDREGVWLMIAVGDIPIHWQATVVLRDVNNRVVLQTAYALSDDSWLSELDGTRYTNLPDLIPNPALVTPSELAAINSAHAAMERSLRVAADLEEVRPDIVAAGGRAAEAIEAAEAAEREANRAASLAAAQDEIVAEHVVTDGRQTRTAVDERILAVGEVTYVAQTVLPTLATRQDLAAKGGRTPATPGFEALGAKVAFGGLGQHTIGVPSDSTANDGNDWVRLWHRKFIEWLADSTRCVYHGWRTATDDWSNAIDRAGVWSDATDGLMFRDTFSNRQGALGTSAPDVGSNWVADNEWVIDENGYLTHPTGTGGAGASMGASQGTLRFRVSLDLRTIAGGSTQQLRVYRNSTSPTSASGIWLGVSANASGAAVFHLYTNSEQIAPVNSTGLFPTNAGWTDIDVEFTLDIQNVTVKLTNPANGQSAVTSGVITESQANTYLSRTHFSLSGNPNGEAPRWKIDSIEHRGAPTPARGDLFEVWNGAIAGAGALTYNASKRAQMFGGKHIDTLLLGFGHNNASQTGEAFAAEIEAFVDAWMAEHPETMNVIITSQNPQFPPAANPAAHAERQMAIRLLARRRGWDYIPVFEAFSALPDGGKSMVGADGVHPTTPSGGATDGAFGAVLWAETALQCILDRQ
ncbi:MAG: SGNH/GDSL hydrolase family protein [Dietzia sp.]